MQLRATYSSAGVVSVAASFVQGRAENSRQDENRRWRERQNGPGLVYGCSCVWPSSCLRWYRYPAQLAHGQRRDREPSAAAAVRSTLHGALLGTRHAVQHLASARRRRSSFTELWCAPPEPAHRTAPRMTGKRGRGWRPQGWAPPGARGRSGTARQRRGRPPASWRTAPPCTACGRQGGAAGLPSWRRRWIPARGRRGWVGGREWGWGSGGWGGARRRARAGARVTAGRES